MPDPHTGPPYPGLGLPLRCELEQYDVRYPNGIQDECDDCHSVLLPVRELAMMHIMDRLTDKKDWNMKVWDEEIVAKWREEAKAVPDVEFWKIATEEDTWDGLRLDGEEEIIKELRSKAQYYEKTGLIPILDADATIVKSDSLVSPELHQNVYDAFNGLFIDQSIALDGHPKLNGMVMDLVHPSMYPLIYGRSKIFEEELVDYWNDTYQWLPANVAFNADGTVKLTSYINNLHPQKYTGIYRIVESLIEVALHAWDQCLKSSPWDSEDEVPGRVSSRFGYPEDPDDHISENWIPSDPKELSHIDVNWDDYDERFVYRLCHDDTEEDKKWRLLRKARIPESTFEDVNYAPPKGTRLFEKFRETGLQVIVKMASIELTPEKPDFPAGELTMRQVEGQMNERICATALYYLDSENITTSTLSFRMRTSEELREDISIEQGAFGWLEQIWGTGLADDDPCLQNYGSVETRQGRLLAFPNVFQHRVSPFSLVDKTRPGHRRFIALWLVDLYQRIISTANVPPQQQDWWFDSVLRGTNDPSKQSTEQPAADLEEFVPRASRSEEPKDEDRSRHQGGKLPAELMEMVWGYFTSSHDTGLLSVEEVKEHRLKLMEARTAFVDQSEGDWYSHTYNFCEH
ncbi:hypothetical protein BU23DRAFT_580213 [Bimuria novae-zelandiae CBS 107.79]|uniref:Uncharacterized protein n=1 Tax=Bimuria novae-zelandiae CBS 107.79 TaxID=1447943 RepID=A0A6A5V961_9PLEO|nr:hypothetical protein BU23DRAFT_580213 [Bimuria novae-zelandiae CBS 107.79]